MQISSSYALWVTHMLNKTLREHPPRASSTLPDERSGLTFGDYLIKLGYLSVEQVSDSLRKKPRSAQQSDDQFLSEKLVRNNLVHPQVLAVVFMLQTIDQMMFTPCARTV